MTDRYFVAICPTCSNFKGFESKKEADRVERSWRRRERTNEWQDGYQACWDRLKKEGRILPAAEDAA